MQVAQVDGQRQQTHGLPSSHQLQDGEQVAAQAPAPKRSRQLQVVHVQTGRALHAVHHLAWGEQREEEK